MVGIATVTAAASTLDMKVPVVIDARMSQRAVPGGAESTGTSLAGTGGADPTDLDATARPPVPGPGSHRDGALCCLAVVQQHALPRFGLLVIPFCVTRWKRAGDL